MRRHYCATASNVPAAWGIAGVRNEVKNLLGGARDGPNASARELLFFRARIKTLTGALAGEHPRYFVGTRVFSSSNQLKTMRISGAVWVCSTVGPTILPSGVTS